MPMSRAARAFCEVARIALPIRLFFMNNVINKANTKAKTKSPKHQKKPKKPKHQETKWPKVQKTKRPKNQKTKKQKNQKTKKQKNQKTKKNKYKFFLFMVNNPDD